MWEPKPWIDLTFRASEHRRFGANFNQEHLRLVTTTCLRDGQIDGAKELYVEHHDAFFCPLDRERALKTRKMWNRERSQSTDRMPI